MKASEVFTPGRYPSITLVDDHIDGKKIQLLNILEAGGTAISLSGPSKSGKTVFVQNAIPKDELIIINAAGVDSPETLWMRVFHYLDTPLPKSITSGITASGSASGKVSGGLNCIVAKGNAEGSLTGTLSGTTSTTKEHINDYLQLLIDELSGTGMVLFIDDFHYMPKDVQAEVARHIKEAIRNDVHIICASVPYHADDALSANPDLSGRIANINFNFWKEDLLLKIAEKGFAKLNVAYDQSFLRKLAREAAGSPQLMQYICLFACFESGIREASPAMSRLQDSDEFFRKVCSIASATVSFTSIYESMKEGPKSRGNPRATYLLKDNSICDVYPIILRAIAMDPPVLTFRYPELQDRIASVCAEKTPSGSSVTGACEQIAKLANDKSQVYMVEWDGTNDVLDIREPHLLFFLRWSDSVDR